MYERGWRIQTETIGLWPALLTAKVESTVRYLGIEVDDAIAEQVDV